MYITLYKYTRLMPTITVSATKARQTFFDLLNAAKYGQQVTKILKNGKEVARIMPPEKAKINWAAYLKEIKTLGSFLTAQDEIQTKQARENFKVREAW